MRRQLLHLASAIAAVVFFVSVPAQADVVRGPIFGLPDVVLGQPYNGKAPFCFYPEHAMFVANTLSQSPNLLRHERADIVSAFSRRHFHAACERDPGPDVQPHRLISAGGVNVVEAYAPKYNSTIYLVTRACVRDGNGLLAAGQSRRCNP